DPSDRRAVVVRARRDRSGEVVRLFSGMNSSMDQICAEYTDTELELLDGFLRRAANAGQKATDELAGD
ncbi:MAG: MarR family transcriptional regulator, partial [Vulcanimicrobiaceae bacterium]